MPTPAHVPTSTTCGAAACGCRRRFTLQWSARRCRRLAHSQLRPLRRHNQCRCGAVRGSAIAELARVVATPAVNHAAVSLATGVPTARAHLSDGEPTRNRHGSQILAQTGNVPPTVGLVRSRFATRVFPAGGDSVEAQPTGNCSRPEAQVRLAIAELPQPPVSPAEGTRVGRDGAGVGTARVCLPELVSAGDLPGSGPTSPPSR